MPDNAILSVPGGQLVHCLTGHEGEITALDISSNGNTAATCEFLNIRYRQIILSEINTFDIFTQVPSDGSGQMT